MLACVKFIICLKGTLYTLCGQWDIPVENIFKTLVHIIKLTA